MAGESSLGGGALGGTPESGASTPDDLDLYMSTLNSPAPTLTQLQQAGKRLLTEWLNWWFDGTTKELGQETAQFPKCEIYWDQHAIAAQPLQTDVDDLVTANRREIMCHLQPRRHQTCTTADAAKRQVTAQVSLEFMIRTQAGTSADSNFDAGAVADLLFAICAHPDARLALARKGLLSMEPATPFPVQSAHYAIRVMRCALTFQFDMWMTGEG